MWLGLVILMLGCACPEKRVEAPPAAAEPAKPPTADTTAPPPSAPPAADTTPPVATTPPATPAETPPPAQQVPPAQVPPATAGLPDKAGTPCDERGCGGGFTCVSYYGIAGPKGPQFKSCEVPCPKATDKCPKGTNCTTIADGPGRVCR